MEGSGVGIKSLLDGPAPGFAPRTCDALRRDQRRILITGAGGWIGRATLDLLVRCLGIEAARERVLCLGSQSRQIEIRPGLFFDQQPLATIGELRAQPTLVLHLAFLTKDKVAGMAEEDYRRINLTLSRKVADALDGIGADRLFVASSGAAAFADDPDASPDLRLYGRLKRDDEELFADWAKAVAGRRAVITRIFNVSGPYINKHQTYALASFILDALSGRPVEVQAPMPVIRGYVAIRELMSLIFSALLAEDGDSVLRFDSGGEPQELAEVAHCVAETLGPVPVERKPITSDRANRYVGDSRRYLTLLADHRVERVDFSTQVIETAAYLAGHLAQGT
jgi:nucleoside-diphosphate-sugar epimerase